MKTAVIINDTSYKPHHGCETVVNNIITLLKERNIYTIATNPVGISWQNKTFLEEIGKADIIIVNGEGTLHHSEVRVKDLVLVGKYVKENFDKPIVLINSIYQENGSQIASYMKYFDQIYVRESFSQKDLAQFNIASSVIPDMTFYSIYNLKKKRISEYIGVTDSVDSALSKKLFLFAKRYHYKFLPALAVPKINPSKYIYTFLKRARFKVFKFVKTLLLKFGIPLKYKRIRTMYYIDEYDDYISEIGDLKFFITGRFHSLCFALKTLTPFVAITSNSHKIEGLLYDIGIGENRIKTIEEIEEKKLDIYFVFSNEEKEKIEKYITMAPTKIESMFDKISELL